MPQPDEDSPWRCICCRFQIDYDTGFSLDDSTELHICYSCWDGIDEEGQVEAVRLWKSDRELLKTLIAFRRLCEAAMCNWDSVLKGKPSVN